MKHVTLTKGNSLLFALKYRNTHSDASVHFKWSKGKLFPTFLVHHHDAILRYRRNKASGESALLFKGVITRKQNLARIIEEKSGDLLDMFDQGMFTAIAHGCNCRTAMSGGIAALIKQRYPQAAMADKQFAADKHGQFMLGRFSGCFKYNEIDEEVTKHTIYNLYTQLDPGADFRISALQDALVHLNDEGERYFQRTLKRPTIGLPQIGCGIGGGDWKEVKPLIAKMLTNWNLVFVTFKAVAEDSANN